MATVITINAIDGIPLRTYGTRLIFGREGAGNLNITPNVYPHYKSFAEISLILIKQLSLPATLKTFSSTRFESTTVL